MCPIKEFTPFFIFYLLLSFIMMPGHYMTLKGLFFYKAMAYLARLMLLLLFNAAMINDLLSFLAFMNYDFYSTDNVSIYECVVCCCCCFYFFWHFRFHLHARMPFFKRETLIWACCCRTLPIRVKYPWGSFISNFL